MYSFSFPTMLRSTSSMLIADKKAVISNLILLLNSERLSLFGDPYYGTQLKTLIYEQSSSLVVDLLIDEIYTTIITFIPQLFVERKDITVFSNRTDIFAQISCTYIPDNTSDLYTIKLTNTEES